MTFNNRAARRSSPATAWRLSRIRSHRSPLLTCDAAITAVAVLCVVEPHRRRLLYHDRRTRQAALRLQRLRSRRQARLDRSVAQPQLMSASLAGWSCDEHYAAAMARTQSRTRRENEHGSRTEREGGCHYR